MKVVVQVQVQAVKAKAVKIVKRVKVVVKVNPVVQVVPLLLQVAVIVVRMRMKM